MTGPNDSTKRGAAPAIIAAALLAAACLLANIPGNPVVGPSILSDGKYGPHFECGVESMVHGWPFAYLRHDGHHTPAGNGPSAWTPGENSRFTPAALAANVTLLTIITTALAWIVRRRIQAKGWRFEVIHLMLAIAAVSAITAGITARRRQHQAQVAWLQRGQRDILFAEWQPFGPYWLRAITEPHYWSWGDRLVAAEIEHSDEIATLPGKAGIKVLRIITVRCDAMPPLDDFDNLVAIDMSLVNYDYANFAGDSDPEFWPCLSVISQCGSLQGLNLYETDVTDRGLQELAQMPNLRHLELSANPGVTDDGLSHLASITSLQKLGLRGTRVTTTGVEKLRAALPDCEIDWDDNSFD